MYPLLIFGLETSVKLNTLVDGTPLPSLFFHSTCIHSYSLSPLVEGDFDEPDTNPAAHKPLVFPNVSVSTTLNIRYFPSNASSGAKPLSTQNSLR